MTLRTALEELAAKWELAEFPSKAAELRAILAAHPDNSTTEWGVQWAHISESYPERNVSLPSREEGESRLERSAFDGRLIARQVTPWQVAK